MEGSKIHSTVGAVIVKNQKVLLMHHKKLDKWLFPGGHIDSNETSDVAVVREVKEETGLDFEFLEFSKLDQAPEEIKKLALPFHSNVHNVGDHDHQCYYFLGTTNSMEFVQNKESKELKWVGKDELDELDIILSIKNMILLALDKYPFL